MALADEQVALPYHLAGARGVRVRYTDLVRDVYDGRATTWSRS
jgi:hypothetical protein